jgi:major membrane immunogen (membrane-anchored lipoprotein)
MSRNQRIGLLVAAALVVVVAVVVAVASGGGDDGGQSSTTTGTTATTATKATSTEQPHETLPVDNFQLQIKGGKPVGGVQDFKVKKGDRVTIVVSADAHDEIHLHGYDIEKPVEPGKPATFNLTADIEGIFEIESHVAEDAGREPLMGKLTVEPD